MDNGYSSKLEPVYDEADKSKSEVQSHTVVGGNGLCSDPGRNGGMKHEMEIQESYSSSSSTEEERHCCVRNLDMCCGDNVRGVCSCGVCLKRAAKESYNGCRHLKCKDWVKDTFTVANARKKFPVSLWLPKYRLNYLLGDVIAGLTVGLTALPQGLAYAKIALLPPQYGLYSLFMPCYAYLFFGTAKDISIGPTAVMSLLTSEFAESPIEGDPTYAIVLAMMCGIIQFLMGFFHLGFLVDFISHPVVHSFTMASVVTITFSQIPHWLGLHDIPREFVQQVYWIFKKLPETQIYDFALGLVCMILLFLMKKMKSSTCMLSKKDSKIIKAVRYFVWLLSTARNAVVVTGAVGLAAILLLYNMEPFTLTGDIPAGLPPFKPPSFSVSDGNTTYYAEDIFKKIGPGLIVVPLLGLVETVAIGKSFARVNKYTVEPNQELLAMGVGNLLGSFVSAYPVTGSFSRSSVNCQSGVRTPGAGFWTGTLVLLVIAFLTPVFYYIPDATLAAIIIMAVLDMADFTLLIELWDIKKIDLIPWFITFVFSLLLGVDNGLLLGIVASLFILLYPPARPKISAISDESDLSKTEKDSLQKAEYTVLELNQGLVFPSAEYFMKKVLKGMPSDGTEDCRSVILDFTHVTGIDSTVIRSIEQLSEDFSAAGAKFVLCNVQRQVLKVLLKAKIKDVHYAATKIEAIDFIKEGAMYEADDLSKIMIFPVPNMTSEDVERCETPEEDGKQPEDVQSSADSTTSITKISEIIQKSDDGYDNVFCKL